MSYAAPYPNCSTQYSKTLPQLTTTSHSHPSLSRRETCHSERSEAESRNLATWQPLSSPVGAVRGPPVPTRHRVAPRPSPPPHRVLADARTHPSPYRVLADARTHPSNPLSSGDPPTVSSANLSTHVPLPPPRGCGDPSLSPPICAIPNPLI